MSVENQIVSNFLPLVKPFSPDDWIVALLLGCFFIICYTVGKNRRILFSQTEYFFSNNIKQDGDLFFTLPGLVQNLLLLIFTSLCAGVLLFLSIRDILLFQRVPIILVLRYSILVAAIFLIRLIIYHLVNTALFDRLTALSWTRFYYINYAFVGFLLFVLSLISVFFITSVHFSKVGLIVAVSCFELVVLYRSFSVFFRKNCEHVYFFVYFCAMELIPTFIAWKFLTQSSSKILNFLL